MLIVTAGLSSTAVWAQIEITEPKNGEILTGSEVRIEWRGAGNLPVSLYYSADDSVTWNLIDENITRDFYTWRVPANSPGNFFLKAELTRQGGLQKIWEIPSFTPEMHGEEIRAAVISPSGDIILTTSKSSNEYRLWDIATRKAVKGTLPVNSAMNYGAGFLHSSDTLVFPADSSIVIYDRTSQKYTSVGKGMHTDFVRCIAIHPFKSIVASASNDGSIRVFDIPTGEQIAFFKEPDFSAYSIAFSKDGEQIAYAGDNSNLVKSRVYVRKWENSSGFTTLEGHGENGQNRTVWALNFSPDGKRIASGGVDKTVRVWNIEKASEEKVLKNHAFHVRSVRFSPDGGRILSGSLDSTIRQWDLSSGVEITSAANHGGQVLAVDYSPTGDTVLSAGRDRTIKLWKNAAGGPENSTIALVLKLDTTCAADKRQTAFGEKTAILAISPNPASDVAKISFTVAEDGTSSLKIIDMHGNLLKTFFTENLKSGRYERDLNLAGIPNGAYVIRLETPSQKVDGRLSIVK